MDSSFLVNLFKFQSDFSQGGFLRFLVIIIFSLIYGLGLAYIYRIYYRSNEPVDISIARALPLMSPAVTMVFWLIQFSLPLSLGLLGALSFVRFRTPVKRAEDIAFILLLVSGALAAAVGHFFSAIVLLLLVGLFGKYRNKFPLLGAEKSNFAIVSISLQGDIAVDKVSAVLEKFSSKTALVSTGRQDGVFAAVFNVPDLAASSTNKLIDGLKALNSSAKIDIYFPENQLGTY